MQSKTHATLFICLMVAAFVSSALARLEERRCVEDKSYFDGCNNCMCLGGRRACTMKACTVIDPITMQQMAAPTIEPPSDFWEPIPDAPLPTV